MAGLQARDHLLSGAIAQGEGELRRLNARLAEKRAELNRLTRETDTARSTYQILSGKATEALVAEGMKSGFVRVVDRTASSPVPKGTVAKTSLAVALGALAGAALASGLQMGSGRIPARAARLAPSVSADPARRKEFGT